MPLQCQQLIRRNSDFGLVNSSVRSDAEGDYFSRPNPISGPATMMAWAKIAVSKAGGSCILQFDSEATIELDDTGVNNGVWNGSTLPIGTTLTVGKWYHFAFTSSGTASGSALKNYLNGVLDISTTRGANAASINFTVGWSTFAGEWLNGNWCRLKVWSAELSAAEIVKEMYSVRPVRTANVYGWYPCLPGAGFRGRDYSGNNRHWTENGALRDEDAPIYWGLGA